MVQFWRFPNFILDFTQPLGHDGHLLVAPEGGTVILDWDLSSSARPRRVPAWLVRSFTIAPDGQTVAVTGGAGTGATFNLTF